MKTTYFVSGLIIGGILVFLFINLKNEQKPSEAPKQAKTEDAWNWPDSLDALIAAKEFHKLIFQTPEFRILEVTVPPGQLDPIHTHKGKSIVWVVNNSPLLYNTFGLDDNNKLSLLKQDTIRIKQEELNIGSWEKPEPPHSVENIGKELFKLYRLEFYPKTN
ncbi:MAG: hypothetical protein IPK91_12040 [Saprospiraceae bacterium]|nr:hypothetical protein [Saprospiraceae bacterium]